jgi:hypothetical protein
MKNLYKVKAMLRIAAIITIAAVIGFSFAACGGDDGSGPAADPSVTYISQDGDGNRYTLEITENTKRSARYAAKEGDFFKFTVELFKNDAYSVALTYTGKVESGSSEININITVNGKPLKITVSGTDMTVISGTIVLDNKEEITLTDKPLSTPEKSPEEKTTEKRWHSWNKSSSSAMVTHSVANDDVCTITVAGSPNDNIYDGTASYSYTVQANVKYTYVFEAWTQTGNRTLSIQYYGGGVTSTKGPPYLSKTQNITTARQRYTFTGDAIPNSGVADVDFQCANQIGVFFVKIISISPTNGGNTASWRKWGDAVTFSVGDNGVVTVNVSEASSSKDTCGVELPYDGIKNKTYKYKFEAWTKSGTRDLRVCFGSEYRDTGSLLYPNQEITITSTKKTYELERAISVDWKDFNLGFNCGGAIGEFYIKVISIEPMS